MRALSPSRRGIALPALPPSSPATHCLPPMHAHHEAVGPRPAAVLVAVLVEALLGAVFELQVPGLKQQAAQHRQVCSGASAAEVNKLGTSGGVWPGQCQLASEGLCVVRRVDGSDRRTAGRQEGNWKLGGHGAVGRRGGRRTRVLSQHRLHRAPGVPAHRPEPAAGASASSAGEAFTHRSSAPPQALCAPPHPTLSHTPAAPACLTCPPPGPSCCCR